MSSDAFEVEQSIAPDIIELCQMGMSLVFQSDDHGNPKPTWYDLKSPPLPAYLPPNCQHHMERGTEKLSQSNLADHHQRWPWNYSSYLPSLVTQNHWQAAGHVKQHILPPHLPSIDLTGPTTSSCLLCIWRGHCWQFWISVMVLHQDHHPLQIGVSRYS